LSVRKCGITEFALPHGNAPQDEELVAAEEAGTGVGGQHRQMPPRTAQALQPAFRLVAEEWMAGLVTAAHRKHYIRQGCRAKPSKIGKVFFMLNSSLTFPAINQGSQSELENEREENSAEERGGDHRYGEPLK
jgi:hypothetical protein